MIDAGKILQKRYRIDKQIGQGGMGAVYIATDERFGSVVAIKETLFMDDNYRKAIEREARLLNSLKHTALPRVSDHFLEENGQFLVMEYIPGEDLAFMLERDGKPFSIEQVLQWADQLLDALDFLHNQQNPVIHRDIKPQNLKITARGQIILLDFGLAKGNPTDAGHQTAAKSIFGYSRNYASLEQIQGTGTDPRSDLYSLAATLYHLATGQPPEDALTRAMSVLSHQPDPLLPAHFVRPEIPLGLSGILQKALDLNAAARPQSALEMREMLGDHPRYEYLAAAGDGSSPLADIDSQKTQLMPGLTRPGVERQTGIKTEILPSSYVSADTALRDADTGGATGSNAAGFVSAAPKRGGSLGRAVGLTSAAGLLIAGTLAAGVYVYNSGAAEPSAPATHSAVENAQPEVIPEANTGDEQTPPTEPADGATKVDEPKTDVERAPAKQVAKSARSTPAANRSDSDLFDPDDLKDLEDLKGKTIYVGNLKIKDGRLETPDTIIDEKGLRPKVPKINVPVPPFKGDFRNLTPAQRRKLQMLRRRNPAEPPHDDQ